MLTRMSVSSTGLPLLGLSSSYSIPRRKAHQEAREHLEKVRADRRR